MNKNVISDRVLDEVLALEVDEVQTDLLSPQQQDVLMHLIKADSPAAKQQLIAHNLRLVVNIAKHYSNRGVARLDLIKEGVVGLIHAVEHFELEGGFRFASYAAKCVRKNIERAISEHIRLSMCQPAML